VTTALKKNGVAGFEAVDTYILNPKAVDMDNLYGFFDPDTREWCNGILATVLRKVRSVKISKIKQ